MYLAQIIIYLLFVHENIYNLLFLYIFSLWLVNIVGPLRKLQKLFSISNYKILDLKTHHHLKYIFGRPMNAFHKKNVANVDFSSSMGSPPMRHLLNCLNCNILVECGHTIYYWNKFRCIILKNYKKLKCIFNQVKCIHLKSISIYKMIIVT